MNASTDFIFTAHHPERGEPKRQRPIQRRKPLPILPQTDEYDECCYKRRDGDEKRGDPPPDMKTNVHNTLVHTRVIQGFTFPITTWAAFLLSTPLQNDSVEDRLTNVNRGLASKRGRTLTTPLQKGHATVDIILA